MPLVSLLQPAHFLMPPAILLATKAEVIRGSSDLSLLQMTIFVGSTQQKGGQTDLYLLEGGLYMKLCLLLLFFLSLTAGEALC